MRTSTGSIPTRRRFTDHYIDDTGLTYMNARYYDPALGAFISPDTIVPDAMSVLSYNRYLYTRGNPLNRIDPSGHIDFCAEPGGCLGGSVSGGAGGYGGYGGRVAGVSVAIGVATGAGAYAINESRQGDGFNLKDDWVDLSVAAANGGVAGWLVVSGGPLSVAGAGMASNLLNDHASNLIRREDFHAAKHTVTGGVGATSGIATAGAGHIASLSVNTGSKLVNISTQVLARGVTGGVIDTLGDVDGMAGEGPPEFGKNLAWNIASETFGQSWGNLGGSWADGAWGMSVDQGNAFWGAWGAMTWEMVELPVSNMIENE